MNDLTLNRRQFAGALALAALLPVPALAVTDATATTLVNNLVAAIQKSVNSGKTGQPLYTDFERIFATYADVPTIARFALGPAARTASKAEMSAYTNAFVTYIAKKYGQRFQEFIGGSVTVKGTYPDKNGIVVVQSVANLKNQSPFAVDFHVSDKSGSARVFNLIIEGVNMLTTERTEVGAMLDQAGGSVAKLADRMKQG